MISPMTSGVGWNTSAPLRRAASSENSAGMTPALEISLGREFGDGLRLETETRQQGRIVSSLNRGVDQC
jgi:hypothetical protein